MMRPKKNGVRSRRARACPSRTFNFPMKKTEEKLDIRIFLWYT